MFKLIENNKVFTFNESQTQDVKRLKTVAVERP